MLGATLVDIDDETGPSARERARGAGVIEVDVCEQERARRLVAPTLRSALLHCRDT